MPLIFVNYRTGDEEATATLVDRELSRVFGTGNVFRASKSIAPGSRFPQELLTAVRRSSVLLAVIGPRWLEAGEPGGRIPREGEEDWTRREIAEALDTGAVVVPLLVGGAKRLRHEDLPARIRGLADRQYCRFSHRNVGADLGKLVDDLVKLPKLHAAARDNGYLRAPAPSEERLHRTGGAQVIQHTQHGGIGRVGEFSGTYIHEAGGPVHTGSGHLYQYLPGDERS
ncbi:toll/interleukin-1 receptor domain-containing protein [Kitasatospora sp. NPDC057965]|uniref:toll/interleukin-1 receptor domain-containing protein n=1 Tax=Kitasatospora sp. NPDC057965 TaxID=3346291 RepID=UPI0036DA2070